jgi:hypothetical protein
MVPAIGLVPSPVGSCVAALVATSLPATSVATIKVLGVIQVLRIKAEEQQACRSSNSA